MGVVKRDEAGIPACPEAGPAGGDADERRLSAPVGACHCLFSTQPVPPGTAGQTTTTPQGQ
ncbi:hypothetical protein MRX96_026345 [Rhipicephalus microplus]